MKLHIENALTIFSLYRVVYFNLGTHHVPHSGDVPNTLMHTSASSVMFIPHNFHDRDPSRESATGAKLDMKGNGERSTVEYFGGRYKHSVRSSVVCPIAFSFSLLFLLYVGVKLTLGVFQDDLEPDLTRYQAPEGGLMELSWNATLAAL